MPTAGRLTGAVFFAALAWYATELALSVMPSAYDRPGVPKWNAILSFFVAWSLFKRLDGTLWNGMMLALTTAVLSMILATLCHSAAMTFDAAWRGRTGSLISTFEKVFANMGDMALHLVLSEQAMISIFTGAFAIGVAAAIMERRFS